MHKSETSHFSVPKHQRPCEAVGIHKRVKRIHDPVKFVVPCFVFEDESSIPPERSVQPGSYIGVLDEHQHASISQSGLGYRGYIDKGPAEALSNDANDQTTSIDSITSPSIDTHHISDQTVKGKNPRKMSLPEDRRWLCIIDRQGIITSIDRSPLNCVNRQSFKSIDRHLTVLVDTHIKVRTAPARQIYSYGWRPSTVRLSPSFATSYNFALSFQCHWFEVNQHLVAEVMPVLLRSGQSASREEAVEKRNRLEDVVETTHTIRRIQQGCIGHLQKRMHVHEVDKEIMKNQGTRGDVAIRNFVECMPVLLRSSQSASREEAVEKRNICRSMQNS
ncbi:hypothetical protein F2Q69_00013363 [Brassica cretica]|uniref:Uncharacterized protein n=1 Tax=Brassica cretica TaxID=69181 RepID=A0A8S9R832_BRACR|nr:hypothetical protein F2Q69_00013363 [Brassica cretica]